MTAPSMFSRGALPVLEMAYSFAEQRHQVIAGNVANVETPFYKARDLPEEAFRGRLQGAINKRRTQNYRTFEVRPDFKISVGDRGSVNVMPYHTRDAFMKHSRNNVNIDKQMAIMSDNALYYSAVNQLLSHNYKMFTSAIQGTV